MKISIITAAWNSEDSILGTLHSIQEQDYPRDQIEWIVIDGASTDRTIELIKSSGFLPDKLISEADEGIYDALNKGVQWATGDVVGFLHADDLLASPGVLNRVACALGSSSVEAVYGDLQYVRRKSGGSLSVVRHWKSGIYDRRKLKWGWMAPHPALYLKKEVYDRVLAADGKIFDISLTCAADYDFMLRLFTKHHIEPAYLKRVLIKMHVGGTSNRSLKHIIQKSSEDWQVIRRNRVGHLHTLVWKNLSKLGQFITRGR